MQLKTRSSSTVTEMGARERETPPIDEYLRGTRLAVVVVSLMLAMFLVTLDNTILGTAIPRITDEFHDLNSVSWYGSAYFMTFAGFQSTWGKVYKYLPIKRWFLIAMCFFELGSLLCGLAKNPTALIVGRAIAGMGGGGVTVGVFTIIGFIAAPEVRPQVLGYTGVTYGISGVVGPLLGGVFTDTISWRWCFYINLPIGALAAVIIFFFKTPSNAIPAQATLREKMLQMDFVGVALMISLLTSFILALQYGGQTHPWSSSTVVGLLVGSVAILAAFIAWEILQKDRAMIVVRLFMKHYVFVGSLYMFFFIGAYLTVLYYLPIYFQSVHNSSPIESGVRLLALIIPLTITALIHGAAFSKIGRVPLFWITSGLLATISSGLFYTMDTHTPMGQWIGFQIILGFGVGWSMQISLSNGQLHALPADLSQVTGIINFFMTVGGAFFLSAAQCSFNNQLIKALASRTPEIDAATALQTGATQIREVFTSAQVPHVIASYVMGLKAVFAITIAAFGMATAIGCFGSWKKIHRDDLEMAADGPV